MTKIKVIEHADAKGRLKEIYDDLVKQRGKLAEVHKIQSLRPESIVKHMDLYLEIMFSKSDLSRAQREMMAVVVSATNKCAYCQVHHAEALINYWKNEEQVNQLRENFRLLALTEEDMALCEYAELLTNSVTEVEKAGLVHSLKEKGFSDEAILDATLVISYFNFVNRIVLALGVEYSEEEKTGYNY